MSDGVLRERLAVLGSPVAHSRSPLIHRAAYAVLGLDWEYGRERLEPEGLAGFLAARGPEWRGFSVTMPLKEEAHRIAAVRDPVAEESGVVNTLLRIASGVGRRPSWAGFNTDVAGLASAIARAGLDASATVVIGSGATAVSAILAARSLGAERVTVLARRPEALAELAARFDGSREPGAPAALTVASAPLSADPGSVAAEALASATLTVSTLPGPAGAGLALPPGAERVPLFDVAYSPWPSPLAGRWAAAGGRAHAGIEMLVEQAIVQIRIFAHGDPGRRLDAEERVREAMRDAAQLPGVGG
ncbi:shikimate dehydrogenase family protein [Leucobacter massiliensis]|uniref:Shikimate dehydrogenase n=1 Tax=Leucobacter massiliensis TaxID=1686285 RepID=A0A2S9QRK8_9MICO|nr:shikimate dehydrogenase [Leucobacter massiliensis]PRI12221.1 shikimate dehydrogenase [Leucobacter massiliensis]